jgi:hypothetical protein
VCVVGFVGVGERALGGVVFLQERVKFWGGVLLGLRCLRWFVGFLGWKYLGGIYVDVKKGFMFFRLSVVVRFVGCA